MESLRNCILSVCASPLALASQWYRKEGSGTSRVEVATLTTASVPLTEPPAGGKLQVASHTYWKYTVFRRFTLYEMCGIRLSTCDVETHGTDCDTGEGSRFDMEAVQRGAALRVPNGNSTVLPTGDEAPIGATDDRRYWTDGFEMILAFPGCCRVLMRGIDEATHKCPRTCSLQTR